MKDENKENEKVVFKVKVKLSLPHKKPEVTDCIVTWKHVLVKTQEPITIAISHISDCYIESGNVMLTFLDDSDKKLMLVLEMAAGELHSFKEAIYQIKKQNIGRFFHEQQDYRPNNTLDKIYDALFRKKIREIICAGLRKLGVDARLAERGRVEEEIVKVGSSLGIIYIPEGPIRWIDVRKEPYNTGHGSTTLDYTEYGVPDFRLGSVSPRPEIDTVRMKSFPLLGKVVDLRWKGEDSDLGIISRLNSDDQLKQPIIESRDMLITGYGDYNCWLMSTQTWDVPSSELWNCYQAIAQHLLAEWPKQ